MVEKPYLFANDRPGRRADVVALVQEAEARGFPGLFSESPGDNLALSLAVLDRTKRIAVGTGIAGIYLRHPHTYRFMRRWASATVSLWRTCAATCGTYAP
jgi:alkanesulfonate monooxygenase SsuD/methylene tetrahydromethanopterin reductase-like flavin-dependent oxidoreductase (luciferase family)